MAIVGIGTDIVEIARIEAQLQRSNRLAQRVLTAVEFTQFEQHSFPARYLAKRFAAKEAAVKALGTGIGNGVGFQHIEISHDPLGQPQLTFADGAKERAEALGVTAMFLSLSDEQHYAVATVVLEK